MMKHFWKNLPCILLIVFVTLYGTYFSIFTINRYEKMYAHYFDLGIMHQTVYNTYKGMQTGDFSRILELTNPHQKPDQIKRMAVHNDIILAFLAPFYFIHSGPETLLVIQSIVLALGAVVIFFISREVLQKYRYVDWIALVFSVSYLFYYPLQKANKYEFHAVTLATTFLLAMYYAYLKKRFGWSMFFAGLAMLTKEQVGLTVAFFGGFILVEEYIGKQKNVFSIKQIKKYFSEIIKNYKKNSLYTFALSLIAVGIVWVGFSMAVIIPYFRGGEHFASSYFDYLTEKPWFIWYPIIDSARWGYLYELLHPVAFLSVLSPLHFLIALPDLGINLLSSNDSMRNTYFHYTAVITPFVFISAIYGFNTFIQFISKQLHISIDKSTRYLGLLILLVALYTSYLQSPLPYARKADIAPWHEGRPLIEDVLYWKEQLKDDSIKVATTGQIAPFFTSRRYFYDFNYTYTNANYIILDTHDVQYGFMRKYSWPAYTDLLNDSKYIKIYDRNGIEVYKTL